MRQLAQNPLRFRGGARTPSRNLQQFNHSRQMEWHLKCLIMCHDAYELIGDPDAALILIDESGCANGKNVCRCQSSYLGDWVRSTMDRWRFFGVFGKGTFATAIDSTALTAQ